MYALESSETPQFQESQLKCMIAESLLVKKTWHLVKKTFYNI